MFTSHIHLGFIDLRYIDRSKLTEKREVLHNMQNLRHNKNARSKNRRGPNGGTLFLSPAHPSFVPLLTLP